MRYFISFIVILFSLSSKGQALLIRGDISDFQNRELINGADLINIHTHEQATTDEMGQFAMHVENGQLLEIRKFGYKLLRVRIPPGNIPSYFKLMMVKLPNMETTIDNQYQRDSQSMRDLYKTYLDFPTLTGIEAINHPFSAMSKRNRQIWAFQKEFSQFEQQKFIDYKFNEKLVRQLTGLSGDSIAVYLSRFRPTYEQLVNMNDYAFYSYVKKSVEIFRRSKRLKSGSNRSAN